MSNGTCNLNAYLCSDTGLLMPFVNEYTWPIRMRAAIYLIGLLWCFMGVSIIADIFMRSIETITSRTRQVRIADPTSSTGYTDYNIKVWNDTVANLTLMALGSSAPEILLSVIEIVFNDFKSGSLGPSTIIGSAAFNLFVITGICILAIPKGEKRFIKNVKVFAVTTIFSIFAYLWLLVILVAITPDYIDLWEAIVTFLFFPVLVIVAYIADKDYCKSEKDMDEKAIGIEVDGYNFLPIQNAEDRASMKLVVDIIKKIGKRPGLTEEDEARITAAYVAKHTHHNKGWYRMNAIRGLTGSSRLVPTCNEKQERHMGEWENGEDNNAYEYDDYEYSNVELVSVIEWATSSTAVMEKDGRVKLVIMRYGNPHKRVMARIETFDGTAQAVSDYKAIRETIIFEAGETSKQIEVEIIDDNEWEPDEVFFVRLSVEEDDTLKIGKRAITQVTILNDNAPGIFNISKPSFVFKESTGKALIPVDRSEGADGRVVLKWSTKDMSAIAGRDYIGGGGELVFEHGEMTKFLEVEIIDDQEFEKDEHFEVMLTEVCPSGAKLGRLKKTVVTILNDDEFKGMVSRIVNLTNANLDSLRVSSISWAQQFHEAMNVNGGDIENAGPFDYIMHFVTFGFKVIFACVPPPSIWGGWLCFIVSLMAIGMLTAIIGDLAGIFGCLVGLKDSVTAITLVALGTSMPDLFASKQAALQEEHADNSIGNITGSNSVNVFLGLGLGWMIAAIYWTAQGQSFEVKAGSLIFSVVLYTIFAIIVIALLISRRLFSVFGKAELGGEGVPKIVCGVFLIFMWFLYIILSSLHVYGHIPVSF